LTPAFAAICAACADDTPATLSLPTPLDAATGWTEVRPVLTPALVAICAACVGETPPIESLDRLDDEAAVVVPAA
jgi:hypothetical protein